MWVSKHEWNALVRRIDRLEGLKPEAFAFKTGEKVFAPWSWALVDAMDTIPLPEAIQKLADAVGVKFTKTPEVPSKVECVKIKK